MNFFEHQAAARRNSSRLVLLFALAVAGIVIAVDLVVLLVSGGESSGVLLIFASLVTLGVIGLGSLYRIASLRGGGEAVALQMGGVAVPEHSNDFNLRRLRNVVEEIAIASGVPMPKLYVLEHEAAINAFAAGYSPSDAVVAVTRGALEKLNRDELQGVIAHEFSHILNGDMRLNIRLIGVLFGILMIALVGKKILQHGRFGDSDSKGAMAILAAALVAMIVGFVGLFFGRLIKAGVSRSRERLADASAVQFTRQTTGLAGALKKIGGVHEGSRLSHRGDAEEISHMLFGDGVGLSAWFATHPPLLERIQALEPGFGGEQLERLKYQWQVMPPNGLDEDAHLGLTDRKSPPPLPVEGDRQVVEPPMVAAQVAQPRAEDYRRADAIVANMPDELRALSAQRDAVIPLLLSLLFDGRSGAAGGTIADKQAFEIAARLGKGMALEMRALHQRHIATLHPSLRLPLAALAFPVLRLRPRPELDVFLDAANAMVYADGNVTLFEYCLARLLTVHVRESLDPSRYARFGRKKLNDVRRQIATLLTVVAQFGHADTETAKRAYLAGMQRVLPSDPLPYLPRIAGVLALDDVWMPLDALEPLAKEALVEAITAAISHDGRIDVAEAELLRTICGVLHCPLPPMLGQPGPR
jgi:Zn-dependent protease with chaperone function